MPNSDSHQPISDHELHLIEAAIKDASPGGRMASNKPGALVNSVADAFPGYSILREIRRGSQGVVYEAVQQATNRSVAIKVMFGAAIAGRRVRFEREVQILARMRHPNIVTIHDSVMSEDRAFFVMDYIDGSALDEHVNTSSPSIDQMVAMFAEVAEAVGSAHLQGVIHRDLKPSNIRIDNEGCPRVLDFGLAKLSDEVDIDEPSSAAVITHTGQFVGSLPWASPEQAEGGREDLDIRTDVYSIGVMMYQALTGAFPYKVTGSMREVTDTICTTEPRRPSALRGSINDEIDMIVLKCLAKEPERRYQSAVELARDLRRYLAGEPIEAKRDSSWYLLRKTILRHRVPVGAGITLLVMLVAFSISVFVLWGRAESQRDIAVGALQKEEAARQVAETEAEKSRQIQEFITGVLLAANPFSAEQDVSVRDALDSAMKQLESEPIDDPEVEAGIRSAMGISYRGVGDYEKAEALERQALALVANIESAELQRLDIQRGLGLTLHHRGKFDEALAMAEETLESLRGIHGDRHDSTLDVAYDCAMLNRAKGKLPEAEAQMREILEIRRADFGMQNIDTKEAVQGLAWICKDQGKFEKSETLFIEAYKLSRDLHGDDHPMVLTALNNLAAISQDLDKPEIAEMYFREALRLQKELLGEDHPYYLTSVNNLGNLLRQTGDLDEAEALLTEAIAGRRRVLGPNHERTIGSMNNLALVLQGRKEFEAAAAMFREAIAASPPGEGGLPNTKAMVAMSNLATVYYDLKDYPNAAEMMRKVVDARLEVLGESHPRTMATMSALARYLLKLDRLDESIEWSERAWQSAIDNLGPKHTHTMAIQSSHCNGLLKAQQYEEAEELLLEAFEILVKQAGAKHRFTKSTKQLLVELYTSTNRPELAEPYKN